jgi:hypothetical protein
MQKQDCSLVQNVMNCIYLGSRHKELIDLGNSTFTCRLQSRKYKSPGGVSKNLVFFYHPPKLNVGTVLLARSIYTREMRDSLE